MSNAGRSSQPDFVVEGKKFVNSMLSFARGVKAEPRDEESIPGSPVSEHSSTSLSASDAASGAHPSSSQRRVKFEETEDEDSLYTPGPNRGHFSDLGRRNYNKNLPAGDKKPLGLPLGSEFYPTPPPEPPNLSGTSSMASGSNSTPAVSDSTPLASDSTRAVSGSTPSASGSTPSTSGSAKATRTGRDKMRDIKSEATGSTRGGASKGKGIRKFSRPAVRYTSNHTMPDELQEMLVGKYSSDLDIGLMTHNEAEKRLRHLGRYLGKPMMSLLKERFNKKYTEMDLDLEIDTGTNAQSQAPGTNARSQTPGTNAQYQPPPPRGTNSQYQLPPPPGNNAQDSSSQPVGTQHDYIPRARHRKLGVPFDKERIVGMLRSGVLGRNVIVRFGDPRNPLYEIVAGNRIGNHILVGALIPNLTDIQSSIEMPIWNEDIKITNVARTESDTRPVTWICLNNQCWVSRSFFERLPVNQSNTGYVMGHAAAENYIIDCVNEKAEWYSAMGYQEEAVWYLNYMLEIFCKPGTEDFTAFWKYNPGWAQQRSLHLSQQGGQQQTATSSGQSEQQQPAVFGRQGGQRRTTGFGWQGWLQQTATPSGQSGQGGQQQTATPSGQGGQQQTAALGREEIANIVEQELSETLRKFQQEMMGFMMVEFRKLLATAQSNSEA